MIANLVNPKTKTLNKRKWVKMKKGDREVEGHILRNKDNVIEMGDVFKFAKYLSRRTSSG
jgi:hypothetical protein